MSESGEEAQLSQERDGGSIEETEDTDESKPTSPLRQEDETEELAAADDQPVSKQSSESTAKQQKRRKLALSVIEKANRRGGAH